MTRLDAATNVALNTVRNNFFTVPSNNKGKRIPVFSRPEDSFVFNEDLSKYLEPAHINRMIALNPEITEILKNNGLYAKINFNELKNLIQTHLPQTKKTAAGIYNNLENKYRQTIDFNSVQKAAFLHDIGKILIPAKYLEKPAKLSAKEFNIIKLHSELGYELLKMTNLEPKVLNLIKYHHQNPQKTGYPHYAKLYIGDLNSQILSTADAFSALTEKRPYKSALSKNQALGIMHERMKNGEIHPYLFKALVDFANASTDKNGKIPNLDFVDRLSA